MYTPWENLDKRQVPALTQRPFPRYGSLTDRFTGHGRRHHWVPRSVESDQGTASHHYQCAALTLVNQVKKVKKSKDDAKRLEKTKTEDVAVDFAGVLLLVPVV